MVIWLVSGVAFAVIAVRRGSLSVGGALMALILGSVVVYGRGGWWLLPLFTFFLSSTLIGRLLPIESSGSDEKDKQPRDAVQVFCNGAVFGAVALGGADTRILLVAIAIAASDTWASEIGRYFRNATYDILDLDRIPPGVSGGVSFSGTLGGITGSSVIALLGFQLTEGYSFDDFLLVSSLGTLGMFTDSLLGSACQARYRSEAGQLRDTPEVNSGPVSGFRWITNDVVNFLSIVWTTGMACLVFRYL